MASSLVGLRPERGGWSIAGDLIAAISSAIDHGTLRDDLMRRGAPQSGALHRGTLRQCALNHNTLGNGLPGMASSLVGLRESERGGWCIEDAPSEGLRPRWCTQERHSETVDPGETRRQGRFSGKDDSEGILSGMLSPAWHPPSWG